MIERDLIREALIEAVGERCPDFDAECVGCQTWAAFDAERSSLSKAREEGMRLRERIADAVNWIEAPFVDENTPLTELRQRIAIVVSDVHAALKEGGAQ